jgi:transcriptional regulator with XRE-family HTH domain
MISNKTVRQTDKTANFPKGGDHLVWVLRNLCRLTPQQIAEDIGVSRNTVIGYLSGHNSPRAPQQKLLIGVAQAHIKKLKGDERKYAGKSAPRFLTYNLAVIALLQESIEEYKRIDRVTA